MKDSASSKKDWVLTEEAFDALLRQLHTSAEVAGRKYEEIRRRLELFFRVKGCHGCSDLADQTLDRGARRLSEGIELQTNDPALYFLGIARNILHEYYREQNPIVSAPPQTDHDKLECRERCFQTLDDEARALLREYCAGDYTSGIEHHLQMAARLGITTNALRLRVLRYRARLMECQKKCLKEKESRNLF